MNIIEAINQVILEGRVTAETNNVTVDNFSPMRNESENITNEVGILTINSIGNDMINKVTNMKINNVRKNLIDCVANPTIKNVRNDINGANTSDVQV